MMGIVEEYLTPPSANPTKYCHFCYSQFRIEPLFRESHSETKALLSRIESIIQVQLSPGLDQSSAICFMCQHKLIEFEAFRDRCQKLHQAVRRCQPFPTLELQLEQVRNGLDEGLECYGGQEDNSSLSMSINPLSFLKDCEDDQEGDSFEVDEEGTGLNETYQQFNPKELAVVDSKEAKKNNRFWQVLSRDVGPIPDHVRNILELSGKCRQESLAYITPSTIKQLEESMRNAVQMLVTYEKRHGMGDRKKALIKYYGEAYWKRPERFCFNEIEKTTMLNIASAVKRKGIRHYLKNTKEVLKKVDNSREQAEILVEKIQKYYRARDSQSEKFQNFFKQLPGLKQIQICRKPNGTIQATIRCPICRKITRAGLTNGCYWYIHNFVSHCEAKHYRTEVVKLSSAKKASLTAAAAAKSRGRKRTEKGRKPRPGLKEG